MSGTTVHLVDGTYELFRQYFGQRRGRPRLASDGTEVGATWGVLGSVLSMLGGEGPGTRRAGPRPVHLGVATDHVIESFRNDLWAGYKNGSGVAEDLLAQFPLLEEGLMALGVKTWAMVDLEADDALASAAQVASADPRVAQVVIWTPDKDLGQCVEGRRVVQYDRRARRIIDAEGVREKFGVPPESIPDWLALVGDSADGFPGIPGWGKQSAAIVLEEYGHLESIPLDASKWAPAVRQKVRAPALVAQLATDLELAVLFRVLATLQIEPSLLAGVDELAWRGPQQGFDDVARYLGDPEMSERALALHAAAGAGGI
jgi:5'-3' exonuclease